MSENSPSVGLRILQLGSGRFLRGFLGWMVGKARAKGQFSGSIVASRLLPDGGIAPGWSSPVACSVRVRGMEARGLVDTWADLPVYEGCLHPHEDRAGFLETASDPQLRVVVSNATEAGYVTGCDEPLPFPALLTAWLRERWRVLGDGGGVVWVLPLELVPGNGDRLRGLVLDHARNLEPNGKFSAWIDDAVRFPCTLVDRIVTRAAPEDVMAATERLGHEDPLVCVAEPYHLLAVAGGAELLDLLGFAEAGLNVVATDDLDSLVTRKVRILNGAHTVMTFLGLLSGLGHVRACVEDGGMGAFLRHVVENEIVPVVDGGSEEVRAYAAQTFTRFRNPWIEHRLEDIALNSAQKVVTRLLPTIADHASGGGALPAGIALGIAAYLVNEPRAAGCEREPVLRALEGIAGLPVAVAEAVSTLERIGPRAAMEEVVA